MSISAALPLPAREWLVAYYSRYHGARADASARHPFRFSAAAPSFDGLDAEDGMRLLKHNLKALGARIPTLYKQYTELCEPGGARFLAFGVDADFADSLDGLIWVDLDSVTPKIGHPKKTPARSRSRAGRRPSGPGGRVTQPARQVSHFFRRLLSRSRSGYPEVEVG